VASGWQFGDQEERDLRIYALGGAGVSGTRCWTDRLLNQRRSRP
jgi:hypothetical protein